METNTNMEQVKNIERTPIQTYLSLGSDETGKLEFDLVTFREKNVSMRYLSANFSGINQKDGQLQESFMNIDSEEAFNELKKFFAQLEWNS